MCLRDFCGCLWGFCQVVRGQTKHGRHTIPHPVNSSVYPKALDEKASVTTDQLRRRKANTDLRVSSSKTLQAQQQAPLQGSTGQFPGSHLSAARFLCSALAVQGASAVFSYRKHGHRVNILVPNLSKQGRKRCWVAHCKCFSGNTTCTQLQPVDLFPSLCTAGRQHINRASKQVSSLKTKPAPSYSQPGARKGMESKAWSKQQVQNARVGLLPSHQRVPALLRACQEAWTYW